VKEEGLPRGWFLAGIAGIATVVATLGWFSDLAPLRSMDPQRGWPFLLAAIAMFLSYRAHVSERETARLRRSFARLRAREGVLKEQAFHDALTKLANRELFADRVEHALALRNRDVDPLAVLFLDLDNFKTVNDTLGHAAGDTLLVAAAERLRACVRPGDTTARLGGDEFAILLEETSSPQGSVRTAERVLQAMQAPFILEGREVTVGTSVGIALSAHGIAAEALLKNADVAMYRAKRQGKGRYAIYAPEMEDARAQRTELTSELERAVARDELTLSYQPVVDLNTGEMIGLEALLRWNHPRRGRLQPKEFMALAEETGMAASVSRWVLERSCADVVGWKQRYAASGSLFLGVNVPARQLGLASLPNDVAGVLFETGFEAHDLMLDLPESVLMQDPVEAADRLRSLKDLGVRLALDNFGRSYLSPSVLEHLPIDVVKIDKYFVDCIGKAAEGSDLALAVIKLAAAFDLGVVAAGIESHEQWETLRALGSIMGQGYLLARPMAASSVEALLAAGARALYLPGARVEGLVAAPKG
jgi:diguanylate cyclase (GGDEF)-like protein